MMRAPRKQARRSLSSSPSWMAQCVPYCFRRTGLLFFGLGFLVGIFVMQQPEDDASSLLAFANDREMLREAAASTTAAATSTTTATSALKSTRSDPIPACTPEQLSKIVQTFGGNLDTEKAISDRIRDISACHNNGWLRQYYQEKPWTDQKLEPFLAISVGCNKGFDAVDTARMLSRNPAFDKQRWKESVESKVAAGLELKKAFCAADSGAQFPLVLQAGSQESPRRGEFHCIEPMPNTFGLVKDISSSLKLAEHGFVVTQAAVSNKSGMTRFPNQLPTGEEAASIFMCEKPDAKPDACIDVPLYRLDDFVTKVVGSDAAHRTIDILTIDAEGYDFDILKGASETLKRVRYLEFEYHQVGSWAQQKLLDAIDYLTKFEFTCYWAGKNQLWRITGCTDDPASVLYKPHQWSNIVCVNHRETKLAKMMEDRFLQTIA